jgi:DNA-binding beta-propeller fold protein YncE
MRYRMLAWLLIFAPIVAAQPYGFYPTTGSTVSVFSTQTLNETSAIPFFGEVNYMAPTPDGQSLFLENYYDSDSTSPLYGVAQINLQTGTFPGLLNIPELTEGPMVVSPNGQSLYIINSFNSNINVVNIATGQNSVIVNQPNGSNGYYGGALAISNDGRLLYDAVNSPYAPAYISIIDTATASVITNVPAPLSFSMAVSPDDTYAYMSTTAGIIRVNLITGAAVNINPVYGSQVVLSPDGARLYAITNQVLIISTTTNAVLGTVTLPDASAYPNSDSMMAIGANGRVGYAAYSDGYNRTGGVLAEIDLESQQITASQRLRGFPGSIALSSGGGSLFVGLKTPSYVSVINAGTDTVAAALEVEQPIGVAVSPDGATVYVQEGGAYGLPTDPGRIAIFNAQTFQRNGGITLTGITLNSMIAVTPDGKGLVIQTGEAGPGYQIDVLDFASQTLTPVTPVIFPISTAAVSPDGYLYVNSGEAPGDLVKYDLFTGEQLGEFPLTESIGMIRFSPSGKLVYIPVPAAGGASYIGVIDSQSMKQVGTIPQCGTAFDVAPNGNIWSICWPSFSEIYEISGTTYSLVDTFPAIESASGVSVSPDGTQVFVNESYPEFGFQVISTATGASSFLQTYISFTKYLGLMFEPLYLK